VLEVVERLCDHIAIIAAGRIVRQGTLNELRSGDESLEESFVRIVGFREHQRLEWLER
jgi:ABC-2 type transport system ATP-binding protein